MHPVPGTLAFAAVAALCFVGGGAISAALAAALLLSAGEAVDGGSIQRWIEARPLVPTLASWALMLPAARRIGGWLSGAGREEMGLTRGGRRGFVVGLGLGAALLLGPAFVGRALGAYGPGLSHEISGFSAVPVLLLVLPALAVMALGEELVFRGFLLRYWTPVAGTVGAVVLTALLFAAVHAGNPSASITGAVGVLLAGLMLALARLTSGSLWFPSGIHLGWNAATACVLGLPVSGLELPSLLRWEQLGGESWLGGAFGPEEGLAYHAALTLGIGAVLIAGPLLQPGSPSSRGDGTASGGSAPSPSPR